MLQNSSTTSSIKENINTLTKLGVEVKAEDSYFKIAASMAVVAVLSRTLQKVDKKSVTNIVKKLDTVIKEAQAAEKIKSQFATELTNLNQTIAALKKQTTKVELFSKEDMELIIPDLLTSAKPIPMTNNYETSFTSK